MPVDAARVEHDGILRRDVELDVAVPEVAVAQHRLYTPPFGLERAEEPGNHFREELVRDLLHLGVRAADGLLPGYLPLELPGEELFPGVGPLVVDWDVAFEGGDGKPELASRRARRGVELGHDGRERDRVDYSGLQVMELSQEEGRVGLGLQCPVS